MPQIKQYDAPDGLGLRPTETGINATAGAARRVQSEYNEAAAAITGTGQRLGSAISAAGEVAVKYIDNQEISAGAKHGADVVAELDKDWNETSKQADPNDSSVAAKWREEKLEPTLQQFRDSFTTENSQKWAEQFVDRYRQHAFVKTAADMSSKAADAVHVNTLGTINGLAIAAYNDPSSLDFARGALKHALDGIVGSSPNLTSAQSSRVTTELTFKGEQEIVRAAVVGTIVRGGDWRALANDPKNSPYIKQTQMEEFARGAKAQQRTDLLTKKQLETSQRQDDVRAAHSQANKIMADNVAIDPATGRPTIKPEFFQQSLDLVKMRNAPDGLGRTMLDWGEKQQQKDEVIHTDPAVKQELTDRMFNEDKPTTRLDLMRAQVQGKLSHQDYVAMERLTTELDQSPLKGPAWRDTMAAVKGTLTYTMPGLPGKDPKGAENYAKFVQDFVPEYLKQSRAGKLQPNALDVKDPQSLISKAMAPYKRTAKQLIDDRMTELRLITEPTNGNLTGPGKSVTGIDIKDAPAFKPPKDWQFSPSRQQYRGPDGKTYDLSGKEVR